ncbi:MAG: hypothetical protein SPD11_05350, partial [Sphaerochaetaceae bacterium]|nr:hypothetical protein [Sphaerochaetaceae bacterium]
AKHKAVHRIWSGKARNQTVGNLFAVSPTAQEPEVLSYITVSDSLVVMSGADVWWRQTYSSSTG